MQASPPAAQAHREGPFVLAIDHGTSGIKAAVVSASGAVLDFEFAATPIHFSPGGGAEQDPNDWWQALLDAGSRLVRRGAVPTAGIKAVCVSSTFATTVAVDRRGAPVTRALTWMDSRGAAYVRRAMAGFPSLQGYNLRRLRQWVAKTAGAPSLSGKDDAGHVLLVRHAMPEVYARTHMFLPSKDYLNLRLTGEFAASYDSVHLFWVTDVRDPWRIRYDDQLVAWLGIDRAKLPPLHAATEVLGPLRPECAAALGLGRDVQVVLGAPDHQCALLGSGAVRDFEAHLYVGTSSWIECLVPFKRTDILHAIATFPTALPGRYQCINEQDLAGGALSFLADNVVFRRSALLQAPLPASPYALLDEIAASVPPGSGRVLFTPWLNGERTPVEDVDVRGGFHNLTTTTTLEALTRAVLEGVAYNTRWSLKYVERFLRRPLDPIRIIGGGAQSALWCQIFADVLQREIHRAVDPRQANARGAAFVAAIGLGWTRPDEIASLVTCDRAFQPDPARRALYDELYAAFVRLYRANRSVYRRLNRVP